MNLYVVRHGETIWNEEGKVQGLTNVPLSEAGIKRAQELIPIVRTLNIDVVVSSPLARAYHTARIITEDRFQVIVDDRLEERDWGLNEGLNIDEVDTIDCWDLVLNTKIQNIESLQDFMYRVSEFIEEAKIKYKDKNVLIVTHSAVSRVIHYMLGTMPEDGDLSKINIPNLRIIEYKL